jgi:hypothetical protein
MRARHSSDYGRVSPSPPGRVPRRSWPGPNTVSNLSIRGELQDRFPSSSSHEFQCHGHGHEPRPGCCNATTSLLADCDAWEPASILERQVAGIEIPASDIENFHLRVKSPVGVDARNHHQPSSWNPGVDLKVTVPGEHTGGREPPGHRAGLAYRDRGGQEVGREPPSWGVTGPGRGSAHARACQ